MTTIFQPMSGVILKSLGQSDSSIFSCLLSTIWYCQTKILKTKWSKIIFYHFLYLKKNYGCFKLIYKKKYIYKMVYFFVDLWPSCEVQISLERWWREKRILLWKLVQIRLLDTLSVRISLFSTCRLVQDRFKLNIFL